MNIDSFAPIESDDKIIMPLSQKQTENLQSVQEQYEKMQQLKRYANRASNKFYAMQILFWDNIMSSNEQCETADNRGKMLSICKNDEDELVIVERLKPYSVNNLFCDQEIYDDEDDGPYDDEVD